MEREGIRLADTLQVTALTSAFFYELPADFDYDGEQHPGWEFVYVERGRVAAGADDATYILKSGEMVCHKPMEFHKLKPYQGSASVIIFCFLCDSPRMQYFSRKILSITSRQKQFLDHIAETAKDFLAHKHPLDIVRDGGMEKSQTATEIQAQAIKNSIELLILSLLTAESTKRETRIADYAQWQERKTLTCDIEAYLRKNLEKPLDLGQISQKFSYSLSSIKRIFKAETGSSVMEYLNWLRMQKAEKLLRETNLSVSEIALETGYANVYYFSNAFQKHTGMRPSRFRSEKQNNEQL